MTTTKTRTKDLPKQGREVLGKQGSNMFEIQELFPVAPRSVYLRFACMCMQGRADDREYQVDLVFAVASRVAM